MGAVTVPFLRELQDIFAGDASVEAKRAAGGNGLKFEEKSDTSEMAPQTQVLTSTPDVGSEDLFTQEPLQQHYVLQLTAVEEEEDLTQIIPEDENNRQTEECIVDHLMSSDEEQNNSEFPNLQPVKPSETYAARQLASLTPSERLALV